MTREWKNVSYDLWQSDDNAVVKIDHSTASDTSRPWLPNYRGWMAFGPGDSEHNYLGFYRRNSQMRTARKFKTPEAAMKAVDAAYPPKGDPTP